jgi:hypothetical protein
MIAGVCQQPQPSIESSHCSSMNDSQNKSQHAVVKYALPAESLNASDNCSHCMMQAEFGVEPTSIANLQGNTCEKNLVSYSTAVDFKDVVRAFPDRRDHGPPGSSGPIYALINIYRI